MDFLEQLCKSLNKECNKTSSKFGELIFLVNEGPFIDHFINVYYGNFQDNRFVGVFLGEIDFAYPKCHLKISYDSSLDTPPIIFQEMDNPEFDPILEIIKVFQTKGDMINLMKSEHVVLGGGLLRKCYGRRKP